MTGKISNWQVSIIVAKNTRMAEKNIKATEMEHSLEKHYFLFRFRAGKSINRFAKSAAIVEEKTKVSKKVNLTWGKAL